MLFYFVIVILEVEFCVIFCFDFIFILELGIIFCGVGFFVVFNFLEDEFGLVYLRLDLVGVLFYEVVIILFSEFIFVGCFGFAFFLGVLF